MRIITLLATLCAVLIGAAPTPGLAPTAAAHNGSCSLDLRTPYNSNGNAVAYTRYSCQNAHQQDVEVTLQRQVWWGWESVKTLRVTGTLHAASAAPAISCAGQYGYAFRNATRYLDHLLSYQVRVTGGSKPCGG